MSRRRIFSVSAILLGLLIASGCGKDKPAPEPEKEKDSPPVVKNPEKDKDKEKDKKPVVEPPKALQVTAIGITEEFHGNPAKAEKKYKGKLLEVEGKVTSSTRGSVTLLGHTPKPKPGEEVSLPYSVKCEMNEAFAGKAGLVAKGQKILVKGRFSGTSAGNVLLEKCEYEEPVESPPRVTAEVLTKAFAEDKPAATKKYLEKDVIVSGTIIDLVAKEGSFTVKLAGHDKFRVSCTLDYEDEFKTLKKGDKVSIKGEVSLLDGNEVVVTTAFLVHKG